MGVTFFDIRCYA